MHPWNTNNMTNSSKLPHPTPPHAHANQHTHPTPPASGHQPPTCPRSLSKVSLDQSSYETNLWVKSASVPLLQHKPSHRLAGSSPSAVQMVRWWCTCCQFALSTRLRGYVVSRKRGRCRTRGEGKISYTRREEDVVHKGRVKYRTQRERKMSYTRREEDVHKERVRYRSQGKRKMLYTTRR